MRVKIAKKVLIALFWVLLWHICAVIVNNSILLPAPLKVAQSLFECVMDGDFWLSAGMSALKIVGGFIIGAALGTALASLAKAFGILRELLLPIVMVLKSIPVASFIILVLIWAGSSNVAVVVTALIAFPILYINTLAGLDSADRRLLEVAEVFHMGLWPRIRGIYLPSLYSHLLSAVELGVGNSVRAGIAAEVIGQPLRSLGNELYRGKIFLDTERVLAVTIVAVILSWALGKIAVYLLKRAYGKSHED